MIKIYPTIDYQWNCPYCLSTMPNQQLIWQGIHVAVRSTCNECHNELITDLPVGHAGYDPYCIDLKNKQVIGSNTLSRNFFGIPFWQSLQRPYAKRIPFKISKRKKTGQTVVIVNCLDYLFGHCLLKLFNVQRHLHDSSKIDVIAIVPEFLVWAVPKEVSEVWSVSLKLGQMREYYPSLEQQINKQLQRFKNIYLSKAYSHPNWIDVKKFTSIAPHDWNSDDYRVTFIWREDRPWFFSFPLTYVFRKIGIMSPLLWWQNFQIVWMMKKIRSALPQAKLTVAGVGTSTTFPAWIDDQRVERPTTTQEVALCTVYAQSRVVIGVHGSSMLLPSAQAGSVINLLPSDRLGNFAQDVMYHSIDEHADPRLISLRYQFLPISTSWFTVGSLAISLISRFSEFNKYFHTRNKKD